MLTRAFDVLVLGVTLMVAACSSPILPGAPGPPPFPPDLPAVVTTEHGLEVRASAAVVATGPTALRVTATIMNPSDEEIVARTLGGDCQLVVVVSWESSPFVRAVQPLDGGGRIGGGILGRCGQQVATRAFPPGETVLTKGEDLVLSEVLVSTFVAGGRYVVSAIFVDEFIYEVLAADLEIRD